VNQHAFQGTYQIFLGEMDRWIADPNKIDLTNIGYRKAVARETFIQ